MTRDLLQYLRRYPGQTLLKIAAYTATLYASAIIMAALAR